MTEPGDPRQSPNLETHKKDRLSNLDLQEDGDLFLCLEDASIRSLGFLLCDR